ncbi:MAG: glycine zipper domain-containing protein [Candidatus Omnitrophota bacterium]
MKKILSLLAVIALTSFIFGCTTAQKGAAVGTVAGAGLGAGIGAATGNVGMGAGIGAAAGAIGGALIGEQMDTKYCPVCGKHYTSGVEYCPEDGAELKTIKK